MHVFGWGAATRRPSGAPRGEEEHLAGLWGGISAFGDITKGGLFFAAVNDLGEKSERSCFHGGAKGLPAVQARDKHVIRKGKVLAAGTR